MEKIRAHSLAPMALDSIRIRNRWNENERGLDCSSWLHCRTQKRPPLPFIFASDTDGNKGVVATWSLGQESLPSSTRNVQEFIRHPWVRGGDESGTGARRGSVVSSASSAVAGAAAGGGVPAKPSPPPPPPAAPPGGRAASSSGASRGPSRSAPSCTRRCRTACPLCAPGREGGARTHARNGGVLIAS